MQDSPGGLLSQDRQNPVLVMWDSKAGHCLLCLFLWIQGWKWRGLEEDLLLVNKEGGNALHFFITIFWSSGLELVGS